MDDLVDLTWTSAPPRTERARDDHAFDALLRSSALSRAQPRPPQPRAPAPQPASQPAQPQGDAFESLLPTSWGAPQKPMPLAQQERTPAPPQHASTDLLDLDFFDTPKPPKPQQVEATDVDDILGELAQPVQNKRSAPPAQPAQPAARPDCRPASFPPHIVGQLVEMGFSPAAAEHALAQCSGNVTRAADMLAEQAARDAPAAPEPERPADGPSRPPSGTSRPAERPARRPASGSPDLPAPADWQKQADALYQHASELGSSVFSRANALWSSAKTHAQRALDESEPVGNIAAGLRREALRRWGRPREPPTGVPRWMAEGQEALPEAVQEAKAATQPRPAPPASAAQKVAAAPARPPSATAPSARPPSAAAPSARQPSARPPSATAPSARTPSAGPPSARPPSTTAPSARQPSTPAPVPAPTSTPIPVPTRHDTPQEPGAVARADSLRTRGNAEFVRGAYAAAEQLYTDALAALHPESLRRVPLLNNRANTRLKNGDSSGAAADASAALALIAPGARPPLMYAADRDTLAPPLAAAVNLREAWAKALMHRASAYEAAERWQAAADDWDALGAFERTHGSSVRTGERHRKAAAEGTARCKNMLAPRPAAVGPAAARPAAPQRALQEASAAGVARVRAQRDAQEAEEAERLRLKDSVDARLAQWTAGKDGNVRALLSSIDDAQFGLLWPELRWKKVGMHELVTDAQVKRAYTRAIARLHPDKQGGASVEQRMLATGMFHALNSAYT